MAIVEQDLPLPAYYGQLRGHPSLPYGFLPRLAEQGPFLREQELHLDFVKTLETLEASLGEGRERENSASEKLAKPLRRGLIGVDLPSLEKDPESKDTNLINGLSNILLSLTSPQTAETFVRWVSDKANEPNKSKTEYLLQSLLHFATLLDIDSYLQFTDSNILPLQVLATTTSMANPDNDGLQQACALFSAQFSGILSSTVNSEIVKDITVKPFAPDAQYLGTTLLTWVNAQVVTGQITLRKGLRAILNYLEMYEAQNIASFLITLEHKYGDDDSYIKLKKRAIEYHVVSPTSEEINQVEREGLQQTVQRGFIDATEISHQISEEIDTVWCGFQTGAFGPYHRAHLHTSELIEELIYERSKADPHFFGVSCIVPAVSSESHTSRTDKSASQVGALARRIDSILLTIRNLKITHVTTKVNEELAKNSIDRINIIKTGIQSFIQKRCTHRPKIETSRIYGTDKILEVVDEKTGQCVVKVPQTEYLGPAIIKVRRQHLVGTLQNLHTIRKLYPQATIVLTPDIPKGSSSEAIQLEDDSYFSRVTLAIINGYWHQPEITIRDSEKPHEEAICSVTEYAQDLNSRIQKKIT